MAKSRVTINPMYTGGAGGYSFYVRGGEQVVRQRKNNSNYGESASRSYAQMIRRIMWGNLVNVYKKMKDWQKKAYDAKLQGQTDYNIFMKLNINNVHVGVTKQACEQGFGVWEPYQIANGSMPPVGYSVRTADSDYETDIVVKQAITAATTIGELSADILANNPQYQAGDNIAFIFFYQQEFLGVEWPYPYCNYSELTLNASDSRLVADIPELGGRLSESLNDTLLVSYVTPSGPVPSREVGFAAIHARKNNGVLSVSTQNIVLCTQEYVQRYSGEEWYNHCIESYGLDSEVPLDPNFHNGIIAYVSANGATLSNAQTLVGSQTIRVYGNKLYGQGYQFIHNGVEYVPLSSTDDYDEFVLTDNGAYQIVIDAVVFLSFNVGGIIVPDFLTGNVSAYLLDSNGNTVAGSSEGTLDGCLNYNKKVSAAAPGILVIIYYKPEWTYDESVVGVTGATLDDVANDAEGHRIRVKLTPNSEDTVCTVDVNDYYVCIANY